MAPEEMTSMTTQDLQDSNPESRSAASNSVLSPTDSLSREPGEQLEHPSAFSNTDEPLFFDMAEPFVLDPADTQLVPSRNASDHPYHTHPEEYLDSDNATREAYQNKSYPQ